MAFAFTLRLLLSESVTSFTALLCGGFVSFSVPPISQVPSSVTQDPPRALHRKPLPTWDFSPLLSPPLLPSSPPFLFSSPPPLLSFLLSSTSAECLGCGTEFAGPSTLEAGPGFLGPG